MQRFLDTIQAGVVYVNRRAGATTGAWPGIQSFGGWKGSGSSGKGGLGPYYVQQFLREQSQTVVGDRRGRSVTTRRRASRTRPAVEPSGWFAVQLRYAYLAGQPEPSRWSRTGSFSSTATDEEAALGRAVEMAPEYEDDFETDDGRPGIDPLRGHRRHQGARRPARRPAPRCGTSS